MTPAATKLLATIRRQPSTTEELAAAAGIAPASVRVLISKHLKAKGVVRDGDRYTMAAQKFSE